MANNWSIRILAGPSPLDLEPRPERVEPVLRDQTGGFVADPFMIHADGRWTLFVEHFDPETRLGRITAAVSDDTLRWSEPKNVLVEPFHLSYPHVFRWQGEYYMTPETLDAGVVRLYRAEAFPDRWRHVADLVEGPAADPTPFRHDGRWWMYTCGRPHGHDTLRLYFADQLRGPWREHDASPVVRGDARIGRPAGRVVQVDGRLVRFAQDCRRIYGESVTAVEVVDLSPETYQERLLDPAPLLGPHFGGWSERMHHIDAHRLAQGSWIACVDACDQLDG